MNSKTKFYFMWDFIRRTRGMLDGVKKTAMGDEMWEDVIGRLQFAAMLIKDTTGKLDNMLAAQYGKNFDPAVFGEEIEFTVERLNQPGGP